MSDKVKIYSPFYLQYILMALTVFRLGLNIVSSAYSNIKSLTNIKMLSSNSELLQVTPVTLFCLKLSRPLRYIANKKGNRFLPCLTVQTKCRHVGDVPKNVNNENNSLDSGVRNLNQARYRIMILHSYMSDVLLYSMHSLSLRFRMLCKTKTGARVYSE